MTASDISVRGATAPLAATFAVQTMAAMVLFGVTVIAPAAAPDIGVEATLIGTFTSIAYGFGMLAGLLTSAVTDRYGAIRICQGTMVFAFIGVAVLTLSTPMAAVASAALLGLCYGPVNPVSTHILARVSPEKWRPMIFSIKQTGSPAGSALAGALLPVIVITFDWRLAIITAGAMALIVAISIQPLRQRLDATLRPKRKIRAGDFINPLKLIWREPRLRSLAVIAFAYSGCQVAISVFYVVYLTAVLALPLTITGLIFTILQVGAIMGRLFWGALADRFYPGEPVSGLARICDGHLFDHYWIICAGLVDFGGGLGEFPHRCHKFRLEWCVFLGTRQILTKRTYRRGCQRHPARDYGGRHRITTAIRHHRHGYGWIFSSLLCDWLRHDRVCCLPQCNVPPSVSL